MKQVGKLLSSPYLFGCPYFLPNFFLACSSNSSKSHILFIHHISLELLLTVTVSQTFLVSDVPDRLEEYWPFTVSYVPLLQFACHFPCAYGFLNKTATISVVPDQACTVSRTSSSCY